MEVCADLEDTGSKKKKPKVGWDMFRASAFSVSGLGVLEFRAQGLGVWGLGLRAWDFGLAFAGLRVWDFGVRV